MASIGFRCSTNELYWALLDGTITSPQLIERDRVRVPQNLTRPKELHWMRQELKQIIEGRAISAIAYKKAESSPHRSQSAQRVEIEAILQELAAELGFEDVMPLIKSQIKKLLGFEEQARYISRATNLNKFTGIHFSKEEEREAVLAAWSLLPKVS